MAFSWGAIQGLSWVGLSGEIALHSYGVAITAFMAGTLWGGTFSRPNFADALLGMAAALVVAFTVWMPLAQALGTLALVLGILWSYDITRYFRIGLPSWYLGLRCVLSSIAILSLLAPVVIFR